MYGISELNTTPTRNAGRAKKKTTISKANITKKGTLRLKLKRMHFAPPLWRCLFWHLNYACFAFWLNKPHWPPFFFVQLRSWRPILTTRIAAGGILPHNFFVRCNRRVSLGNMGCISRLCVAHAPSKPWHEELLFQKKIFPATSWQTLTHIIQCQKKICKSLDVSR